MPYDCLFDIDVFSEHELCLCMKTLKRHSICAYKLQPCPRFAFNNSRLPAGFFFFFFFNYYQ